MIVNLLLQFIFICVNYTGPPDVTQYYWIGVGIGAFIFVLFLIVFVVVVVIVLFKLTKSRRAHYVQVDSCGDAIN